MIIVSVKLLSMYLFDSTCKNLELLFSPFIFNINIMIVLIHGALQFTNQRAGKEWITVL